MPVMQDRKPQNFEEFWPFYVSQHSSRANRRLHFLGTSLAFLSLGVAAILERPVFLLAAVIAGYLPSWIGHFTIEHNRPATLTAPLWSLRADLRMFYLMLNGKMDAEIERLGRVDQR